MTRQTVTPDELASLMTRELQRRVGHQNCCFKAPFSPQEPDEDGCNWSPPFFRRSGLSEPECRAEAAEVTQWARQRYNVKFP
jgi:hypothetical protein